MLASGRAAPAPHSASTSRRATSSRCRSRCRISSAARRPTAEVARNVTQIIAANLQALRPVRADRSGGLHREDLQLRRAAALSPTGAPSTRRRWSPAASRARATAGSRPNSGCGTCSPASSSPASSISPRPTTGGASRTSSPTRSIERLTGEKGYFDSRIVFIDETGRRSAASSASPSWIRTAPMCAISRAARTSC